MAGYRTRYATMAEAEADGWTRRGSVRGDVRDTSGPNSFGYDYTLFRDGKPVVHTHSVWFADELSKMGRPGCFAEMFRDDEINA